MTVCLLGCFSCEKSPVEIIEPDPIDTPDDYTIRGQIYSLPEDYSLFKEVLKRSGLAKTLADTTQSYTFFVQDNAAFASANIHNTTDLLTKLRAATPDIENDSVLLAHFIAYRTISGVIETDSLFKIQELETLVDKEKIFLSLDYGNSPKVLKLNDLNGHLTAPDATLDSESEYSNLLCSNGIIHKIDGNIWVKNRKPYRIYWDLAEQPEIMALPEFRNCTSPYYCDYRFYPDDLSEVTWGSGTNFGSDVRYYPITYQCHPIPETIDDFSAIRQYAYSDYLRFNIYYGIIPWIEFKTPVLIGSAEGTEYNLWLCWRNELYLEPIFTFKQEGYEDQILPEVFEMHTYMTEPIADGFKQYNAKRHSTVICSHILGTIKVYNTGRHYLHIGGQSRQVDSSGNWDMIQFIPVDEDQFWPRVDILGNWIGKDVEICNIFPYEECAQ